MEGMVSPYSSIVGKYDLIVHAANLSTKKNQSSVRIEWAQTMGAKVPICMNSVQTLFISPENPCHLVDVPRVRSFISTHGLTETILDCLADKLTGRSALAGTSPVDAFRGMWDARL
jgi:beta-N-acetylhexosaminidase